MSDSTVELDRLQAENEELRRLLDLPAKDSDSDGQAGCTPMHEAWKSQVRYLGSQQLLQKALADLHEATGEIERLRAEVLAWQKQFADVNDVKEILLATSKLTLR